MLLLNYFHMEAVVAIILLRLEVGIVNIIADSREWYGKIRCLHSTYNNKKATLKWYFIFSVNIWILKGQLLVHLVYVLLLQGRALYYISKAFTTAASKLEKIGYGRFLLLIFFSLCFMCPKMASFIFYWCQSDYPFIFIVLYLYM